VDRAARTYPGNPRRAVLDLPAHSPAMGQNTGANRAVAVGLQPQRINTAGSKIHGHPTIYCHDAEGFFNSLHTILEPGFLSWLLVFICKFL